MKTIASMSYSDQPMLSRGRPKSIDGTPVKVTLRLSEEQREKLDRLGGAAWVRKKIEQAQEPREARSALGPWKKSEEE